MRSGLVPLAALSVGILIGQRSGVRTLPLPSQPNSSEPSLESIRAHDPQAEVRTLRPGEQLVLWRPQAAKDVIWGGGGRVSLFVVGSRGWRHVGDVDSESDISSVSVLAVLPTGIAVLVESFAGNGAPPSRVYAIAISSGHVVTLSSPDVARVDVDDIGDVPEVRVWQRRQNINPYPDEPLSAAHWQVTRKGDGLVATETSLTPWVDVISLFCSRAHAELADAKVLVRFQRCVSRVHQLQWRADGSVAATLGLTLHEPTGDFEDVEGQLVLRQQPKGWRVVDIEVETD
jgi:hypothetical protein